MLARRSWHCGVIALGFAASILGLLTITQTYDRYCSCTPGHGALSSSGFVPPPPRPLQEELAAEADAAPALSSDILAQTVLDQQAEKDLNSSAPEPVFCLDTSSASLTRDIMWQERWDDREVDKSELHEVLSSVHYVWCGKQSFQLQHYLGLLSAIRVLHPAKIIFHHTDQPPDNDYHTWFQELSSSFAGLELRSIAKSHCQRNRKTTPEGALNSLLSTVFGGSDGGYFLSPGLILARPPTFPGNTSAWVAQGRGVADPSKVIVAIRRGSNVKQLLQSVSKALFPPTPSSNLSAGEDAVFLANCVAADNVSLDAACVAMDTRLHPQAFMTSPTPFAELARWLFYGRRAPQQACRDPSNPIPRLAHYIKMKPPWKDSGYGTSDLSFNHFLSIISALYVGGFERVYLHTDRAPTGRWWQELSRENVTVVPLECPSSVFRQPIKVIQHAGDVLRMLILDRYGGAYQDFDVVWVSRVPDWLLEYPAVMGMDWVCVNTDFPEIFNNGVFMATAGSAFIRHYMKTYVQFRDKQWAYNSLYMSFRTYELYPDSLFLDRHLQVICHRSLCHPAWEEGYQRTKDWDRRATLRIKDWKTEVRAFHVTSPKPHPSLASPKAIATRKGLFARVGRYILEQSGRQHLLDKV